MVGPTTVIYDLADRTAIPGVNDARVHWGAGPDAVCAKISGMDPEWSEVLAAIKAAAAGTPKGSWINASVGGNGITDPTLSRESLDPPASIRAIIVSGTPRAIVLNGATQLLLMRWRW